MSIWNKLFETSQKNRVERNSAIAEAETLCEVLDVKLKGTADFISAEDIADDQQKIIDAYLAISNILGRSFAGRLGLKYAKNKLEIYKVDYITLVREHNDNVAAERVDIAKKLIGKVEGRELDDQQMKCIIKPMHNHLVIAGAGTGKTTTIVGKVKYLLTSNLCEPKDILVLSFTNKSATEMGQRISAESNVPIEASTFHKLGINILTEVNGIKPKITRIKLNDFVRNQLEQKVKDVKYLQQLCRYLLDNYRYSATEFDFTSENEYEDYLRLRVHMNLIPERQSIPNTILIFICRNIISTSSISELMKMVRFRIIFRPNRVIHLSSTETAWSGREIYIRKIIQS